MSLVRGQLGLQSEDSPCHFSHPQALHSYSSKTGSANSETLVCPWDPETHGSNDENRQAFQSVPLIKMENFRIWNVVCILFLFLMRQLWYVACILYASTYL